ncbi:hypothetical protein [Streptomyces sp. NPDC001903]|uniref:hypothetical protein n=1 Tax=Streptomyces sp. NPDC001903 TaxID=3364622 RepID=UPI0036C580DC
MSLPAPASTDVPRTTPSPQRIVWSPLVPWIVVPDTSTKLTVQVIGGAADAWPGKAMTRPHAEARAAVAESAALRDAE